MENPYESPALLHEYLLFHYGSAEEIMPWDFGPREALYFPARTVTELAGATPRERALDLGCAVGRSSFELSRFSGRVTGVDFSRSFIDAAETLRTSGSLAYSSLEEAGRNRRLLASRPEGSRPERVHFEAGDAMHLREDLGDFDLVHAANLLCRLPSPALLLQRLPALVRPGGMLIITTPCTWLEDYTPAENWPAGSTFDWLCSELSPHFSLTRRAELPFVIREHARKFQWSVALGTVWSRK
jgi:putative 4-mercaptohistidine N1-methyltranferase